MPLATLKEVLGIATQSKTAIPGFNIDNIEIPEAIITAAEEYHCPVILTIGQGAIQGSRIPFHRPLRSLVTSIDVITPRSFAAFSNWAEPSPSNFGR